MDELFDANVGHFARLPGETDDSGRIQRAVDACPGLVVYIPAGEYAIARPIRITNCCSLWLHKSARLIAVAEMDYVVYYDGTAMFAELVSSRDGVPFDDQTLFIRGGDIDGRGLASCLCLNGYHHFTLKDLCCHNGKHFGLKVGERGHGYELMATNIYCKCTMPGLAGNVGISSNEGDSHYTDCVVVDYTVGMEMLGGGSNRLTRCHVWGGILPPVTPGGDREMLADSINYRIRSTDALLEACYADTGKTGFLICDDTRLLACAYYNNYRFLLDDITILDHRAGKLLVADGYFTQQSPRATLYRGEPGLTVLWRDNLISGPSLRLPEDGQ